MCFLLDFIQIGELGKGQNQITIKNIKKTDAREVRKALIILQIIMIKLQLII